MKLPHPIVRQLAKIRRGEGLTQAALAGRLFLTDGAISQRETGHTMPGLEEADRHARALGYRIALIPLQDHPREESA